MKQNRNYPMVRGAKGDDDAENVYEAKNTLRARQSANIIDALCEGPIDGLVGGLRGIYLNDTPIQNKDGSFNFKNVGAQWRNGSQSQAPLEGFDSIQAETMYNVEIKKDVPVVAHLNSQTFDYARVTIYVPSLCETEEDGDMYGTSVSISVYVQADNAGFPSTPVLSDTIKGKTVSKYPRSYTFKLPPSVNGTWDIRVVRNTPDASTVRMQNKTYLESVAGIVKTKLSYANTALVGVEVDASQFSNIPSRAYQIRGLVVRVPSNYTPASYSEETGQWTPAVYSGIWDGTFKPAWTNNPAWCFYDLLMSERYGLGEYFKNTPVDKWSLYTISQYCDAMVPDGFGGMEPRFTCNLYLQTDEEAFRVVQNFASIFRAITFYGGGSLFAVQDAPHDPIALFTNANVIDGDFNYPGSSAKQRHTVALVTWNDPADGYKQRVEYVDDPEGIKQWGVIQQQLVAFGCTSRGQAHRLGKWLIATEQMCSETVEFRVGLDGCTLYPGAIIQTSDAIRAQARMGGRITDAAEYTVTLDAEADIESGRTYTLQLISTAPSGETGPGVVARPSIFYASVTNGVGKHKTLNLDKPVPYDIAPNAVFILSASDLVPETWRVIDVREGDEGTIEVSALRHIPQLYDYVERDIQFTLTPTTRMYAPPDAVSAVNVVASRYLLDGALVGVRATVSWVSDAARFRIQYRQLGGTVQTLDCYTSTIDIENLTLSSYEFVIVAISAVGKASAPTTIVINMATQILEQEVSLPPASDGTSDNPLNLSIDGGFAGTSVSLRWSKVRGATFYRVEVGLSDGPRSDNFIAKRSAELGNTQRFTYTVEDMLADGGPWREIYIRVYVGGSLGAGGTTYSEVKCRNDQIGPLLNPVFSNGVRCVYFNCDRPGAPDFAGIVIHMSTVSNFAPSPATIVYDGANTNVAISTLPDGSPIGEDALYFFRVGAYDMFDKNGIVLSEQIAASSVGLGLRSAVVYAYQRSTTPPLGSPGRVEFDFSIHRILTSTLQNNWQKEIPDGTGPLWVTAASASGQGAKDFIEEAEWSDGVVLAPGGDTYITQIESSIGDRFKVGQATTAILRARVFCNGLEVTNDLSASQFRWTRQSFYTVPPPNDDAAWNALYQSGYKQVEVTLNDVTSRATFTCEIMTES